MYAVAAGPNAIPVSPQWGKKPLSMEGRANTGAPEAKMCQHSSAEQVRSDEEMRGQEGNGEVTTEVADEGYRQEEDNIVSQWWLENCASRWGIGREVAAVFEVFLQRKAEEVPVLSHAYYYYTRCQVAQRAWVLRGGGSQKWDCTAPGCG
ncbi:uncharacterized protein EMH_0006970 [Eimeria mitis]|uniref:Uncharacterized protein n=1 Tax=Eimeria mitis TaxID=44415 RepID=U6JYZ4_9EIME|nr:uncharacterized protein EMH_0006970 [Eimeria mitis]CDJ30654.1 hypothetical protein EMH_0006970 [Eimeria mitis]